MARACRGSRSGVKAGVAMGAGRALCVVRPACLEAVSGHADGRKSGVNWRLRGDPGRARLSCAIFNMTGVRRKPHPRPGAVSPICIYCVFRHAFFSSRRRQESRCYRVDSCPDGATRHFHGRARGGRLLCPRGGSDCRHGIASRRSRIHIDAHAGAGAGSGAFAGGAGHGTTGGGARAVKERGRAETCSRADASAGGNTCSDACSGSAVGGASGRAGNDARSNAQRDVRSHADDRACVNRAGSAGAGAGHHVRARA